MPIPIIELHRVVRRSTLCDNVASSVSHTRCIDAAADYSDTLAL